MFVTLCGKKPLSVSLFTARSSSRLSLTQTIYAVLMASVSRCAQKFTEVSKSTSLRLRDSQILSRNLPPINLDRRHVCGMDDPAAVRSRCECRFSCVGISPLARQLAVRSFVVASLRIQLIIQRRRFNSPFAKVGKTRLILESKALIERYIQSRVEKALVYYVTNRSGTGSVLPSSLIFELNQFVMFLVSSDCRT